MSLTTASNIAQSALATVAAESAVTSRNISGANATGTYSRKVANIVATPSGAQVVSITRVQNQALFSGVLSANASSATQTALSNGLTQLNQTIGSVDETDDQTTVAGNSPSALLSTFTNALQSYASQPSSTTLGTAAVDAATSLASGLNTATSTVQGVREQADQDMSTSVSTINSLLGQFGALNTQVMNGTATGADVTDAEDSRDDILKQLSQQIGITTNTDKNDDVSIYTDSGVTLFQGTARSVTMQATTAYTAATTGKAVYVDGVPVTGAGSPMPITSGKLAGLATLRDSTTVTYQAQLDQIASGLVSTFKESDKSGGGGADQAGLFTNAGSTTMPATSVGLAGSISVSANVDPSKGGVVTRLRDGGISDTTDADYTYNSAGYASYSDRINGLISGLNATSTFSSTGQITTTGTLADYTTASAGWLEAQRSSSSSASAYTSTLLSTATTALSNSTGVSLDDEMSKMLDIENSYSSSAKLLTTINSMFTTLMTDLGTS